MEFKVKLGYGLSHTVMSENKEIKSNYNTHSNWGILKHGVRQGSILDPQPSILNPSQYFLLMILVLFIILKATTFKSPLTMSLLA
jgi:hypothetical protein